MGAGASILGLAGEELTEAERRFFAEAAPWGFILFDRNLRDAAQIRRLTDELRAAVGRDAPIFIDQEGGRVARLGPPLARAWPAPLDQMAMVAPARAARAMWLRYRLIAAELAALGIDANCAPIADIATPETHPVLRNRCYGSDPDTVARAGRAVADGCLAGGVLPVLKHIPGHGRATADSHLELPRVSAEHAMLAATDFAAFRALADLPLGMTAHIVYEGIDPERPATESAAVVALIRDEIGFDGVLMTDDISMSALSGGIGARAARAMAAGCDMILHCNGDMAEMEAVAAAAGPLSEPAALRAARAVSARRPPEPADLDLLDAEYRGLLAGAADG
ncbi:beta-N-acetylhexosaminidase [Rhodovulum sp. YNF3179]|uniref:beta-N-acetylhexosaminidase n=1 Tax=Rhodovulum sp. YNF3179 TaxID=3425127 RepID=UPI003D32C18B